MTTATAPRAPSTAAYLELARIAQYVIASRIAIPEHLGEALQIGTYAATRHLHALEKPWGVVGRTKKCVPRVVLIHIAHTQFVVETIAKWHGDPPQSSPFIRLAMPTLTAEQHQVIRLIAEGFSNKQIARRLGVSETTAKNHVNRVIRLMDAPNRQNLVHRAHLRGVFGDIPKMEAQRG